ncbi:DUF4147 domain-containing protein [Candidatus Fermentibacteria bacterium]|nr:DUF4147 domain-containing protein [Candidatus Fermentibacteria bacterium]
MESEFDIRLEQTDGEVKTEDDVARAWGVLHKIARAALEAVQPCRLMSRILAPSPAGTVMLRRGTSLTGLSYRRLFVVALGKAAPAMAAAASTYLSAPFVGIGVAPKGVVSTLPGWLWLQGDHPIPTWRSVRGALAIRSTLTEATREDLALVLLSGGSSALAALPVDRDTTRLRTLTQRLLEEGASIYELNEARRQIDLMKGGGMARWACPAQVVGLILSDVPGNPLWVIGSGPTTGATPVAVQRSPLVISALDAFSSPQRMPRPRCPFPSPLNFIVGSNETALEAAAHAARAHRCQVDMRPGGLRGEAREIGRRLGHEALQRAAAHHRHCIVLGGETTVTVRGRGVGGRNTELAMAFAMTVAYQRSVWLLTLATDGVDGISPAAGALVGPQTMQQAMNAGMDPQRAMEDNASYDFLSAAGATLRTGPTNTNVADIALVLINP